MTEGQALQVRCLIITVQDSSAEQEPQSATSVEHTLQHSAEAHFEQLRLEMRHSLPRAAQSSVHFVGASGHDMQEDTRAVGSCTRGHGSV